MQSRDEKGAENAKILIVEDSEVQAFALKKLLVKHGYEVIVAKNGAEGLGMARTHRPAVIISDIRMPMMDGYQMTKELKKDVALQSIPVLLLTQLVEVDEVINGLNCGAENYTTKPYDESYLLTRVESLLKNPCQFKNNPADKTTEFEHGGKRYFLRAGRGQTMSFLLSTYENAVLQNKSLIKAQEELQALNEQLEKKVSDRTKALSAEVAERRQAEKSLSESEERFRAIVESANDAVVCLEPPGNIYLWNSKAVAIFGYTTAEAIGKYLHEMIVPEKYRKAATEGLHSFIETGKGNIVGRTIEVIGLKKDGTEFPVELSVAAVNLHGTWNSIGIIRDITERKMLEEDMKENLDEMDRMNKLMVGREIKMEELRQEISALRAKIQNLEKR